MDGVVTVPAYDQRLPLPCGPTVDPWGFLFSPLDFAVRSLAHMGHCAMLLGSAQCAGIRQEPFDARVATAVKASRDHVVEDGGLLSSERDTTEGGSQWLFVLAAVHRDFEALHGPVGGMHRGAVGVQYGAPACFVRMREGAEERLWQEPVPSAAGRDVGGQQGVWHDAPRLRLVPLDDGRVVLEEPYRSMGGGAVPPILRAVGIDDRRGHAESDAAVQASLALPGMLIMALLGDHVRAEAACLCCLGMRDTRLFCCEVQRERAVPQRSALTCDGCGFGLGSREAEQEVVRVAGVTEPSRVRGLWIPLRQLLQPLAAFPCLGGLSCLPAPGHPCVEDAIGGIGLPRCTAMGWWQARLFDA